MNRSTFFKIFLLIFSFTIFQTAKAQLGSRSMTPFSLPSTPERNYEDQKFDVNKLPTFGLYGIGNTNTESFQNLNSSGKISGYIRPFKVSPSKILPFPFFVDLNFGFNVNASNTDSLLVSTFLFPDVGNNSFSTNLIFNFAFGKAENFYFISPFFEFANKTIKSTLNNVDYKFFTLNSSIGINFQYLYLTNGKNANPDRISFTISPYLAWVNVPNPGSKDYKFLFTKDPNSPLTTNVKSWGIKSTFQYNNFQIFADFRTVKGTAAEIPVEGLLGFHPNIGVIFNAEIFEK